MENVWRVFKQKGDINGLLFERLALGRETRLEADVRVQTIHKYTLVLGNAVFPRK